MRREAYTKNGGTVDDITAAVDFFFALDELIRVLCHLEYH
jgi:hypothetical protein